MIQRLHPRFSAAEIAVMVYAAVIALAGAVSLAGVLMGKDTVVLWPLALVSLPLSVLWSRLATFGAVPDELWWLVPFLAWATLLLTGLAQPAIIWGLLRRARRRRQSSGG
ncbi:hypothetical protein SMD20_20210 [Nonomuraea sp. LP-02]|uniref:hypothetical protein n=1 Tax=Nonomuraea sp. LP-02 TaxID=3097960 RepID=UPI002E37B955|nr:hypothetical protein [Nonomuraea sp. LP-02]MED7926592.1 hypothetical protein [Nonomuraea sp. LP-02]